MHNREINKIRTIPSSRVPTSIVKRRAAFRVEFVVLIIVLIPFSLPISHIIIQVRRLGVGQGQVHGPSAVDGWSACGGDRK